jgi:hypothetical protein
MRANDKMSTKGVRALGRNVAAALLVLASASVTSEPAVAGCSGRNCYNPKIGTDYGSGYTAKSRTDYGSPKSGTDTSKGLTYHVLKAQKQKYGRCRNC